jgi:precorrin-4/cobalt-precorrin-4 C11-methyltransferase
MVGQVYFIGAGPGDPELLTIKARRIIEKADVIVYADSLINPDICACARKGAEVHPSASLTLEETHRIMSEAAKAGKTVARLQSGDPDIFGAINEQMALLDQEGIDYEVVPGVSSLFAAAALLKNELTVPELSQTVIITRLEGKTPVPVKENLRSLAEHQATLAVFLSVSMIEQVQSELQAGGYPAETPAAVVYRASWPDQKVLRTTLDKLAGSVKEAGITRQALILVGRFLQAKEKQAKSKLYDRNFKHGYR